MTHPVRGQVYMVEVPEAGGGKPFLVLSNNVRNRTLDTVVCARITTSPSRPEGIPSVVPIRDRGAVVGKVLCDDLVTLRSAQLRRRVGVLPPHVMRDVGAGLRSALDCDPVT